MIANLKLPLLALAVVLMARLPARADVPLYSPAPPFVALTPAQVALVVGILDLEMVTLRFVDGSTGLPLAGYPFTLSSTADGAGYPCTTNANGEYWYTQSPSAWVYWRAGGDAYAEAAGVVDALEDNLDPYTITLTPQGRQP